MRSMLLAVLFALWGGAAHAAPTAVDMATISMSAPGVPRTVTNTVCATDGNDLVCDRSVYITPAGQVGIGPADPSNTLHIYGPSASGIIIGRAGAPGNHGVIDYSSSTLTIGTKANDGVVFQTSGLSRLGVDRSGFITTQGDFGVRTYPIQPSASLHVSGTLRLASGGESCDGNRTGAIRYTGGDFSFCRNGSAWESLTSLAGGGIASPTNVPAFRAEAGSNQGVGTGASLLTISNKIFDNFNNFNTGNARFTPQVAGTYVFNAWVASSDAGCYSYLAKNGNVFSYGSGSLHSNVTSIVSMNGTTDYVQPGVYCNNAATIYSGSNFNGSLVASGNGTTSGSTALGDRITSGTSAVVVNSATGIVSISQLGAVASYVHPSLGYVGPGVSTTGPISGTEGYFGLSLRVGKAPVNAMLTVQQQDEGIPSLMMKNTSYSTVAFAGLGMLVANDGRAIIRGGWGPSRSISINDNGGYVAVGQGTANAQLDVSATSLYAGASLQLASPTAVTACNSGSAGTIRYNSPTTTLELCTGSGWQPIGVGIPAGTISAFASTTCPTGWSEYTAARGRFLRGIDNGAGNDPSGTRAPGAAQADDLKSHTHPIYRRAWYANELIGGGTFFTPTGTSDNANVLMNTNATGGAETRPKNVAVTFCQFNGTSNGWNNPLSGGSTVAAGSTGQVQYNTGNAFDASAGLTWTNASSRLTATNVSATSLTVGGLTLQQIIASTSTGQVDRITSGTSAVVVNSATGIVSFTQLGAVASYVHPSMGYVGPGVSTTGPISGTVGYFSGDVGIGATPASGTALLVAGTGIVQQVVRTTTTGSLNAASLYIGRGDMANGYAGLSFMTGASQTWLWNVPAGTNDLRLWDYSIGAGDERLRIQYGTGRVGIGASSPTAALDVSGTLRVANGGEACTGTVAGAMRYTGGDFSFCRNGSTWETMASIAEGDNLGNHTATTALAMGSNRITYGNVVGDKVHWYSNSYGTGVEGNNLTNWSAIQFRWRIGGTSVSTGAEYMTLNTSGLNVGGLVSASGFSGTADSAAAPDFTWDGNSNTGMFRPAANMVGFATNGTEAMRITASNQIGVGITAPSTSLHTAGTLRIASGGEACDANRAGALRWSGSQFQVCYGSGGWALLSSAAVSGGTVTLTGDVTGSGTSSIATTIASGVVGSAELTDGGIATVDLANSAVTYAKLQNVAATNRLLGRASAGAGVVEELTIGGGLLLTGTTLSAPGDGAGITALTGDVTASGTGSVAATIANNAVTSAKILDGAVATADLANDAVTNAKLANNSVASVNIIDGAIITADITNSAITFAKMQNMTANNRLLGRATAGAGDVQEITLGTGLSLAGTTLNAAGDGTGITALTGDVTASGTGSVVATIANNAVTSAKIVDGGVATADLANDAVTNVKLASNAVDSSNIIDGSIVAADISTSAVTTVKIADNAVTTVKIPNSAVTYAKMQNVSTNNRLLGRATAGAGDVQEITLGTGLSLAGTTLNAAGDGTGITALTGDVTASGTGSVAATIANNAVTSAKILDGAVATADLANDAVTNVKLATNAVDSTNIIDGTIATADVATSAITYSKMQNMSANNRLLGRATAGAGDVQEIVLGTGLSLSGTTIIVTVGVPTGAIMAFDLTSCPSGWTEYTASRGRFLRGIDNGAANDPDGTRAPGAVQSDDLKAHTHTGTADSAGAHTHLIHGNTSFGSTGGGYGLKNSGGSGQGTGFNDGNSFSTGTSSAGAHTHSLSINNTGGTETRPKNVAVLYCRKS